MPKRCAPQKVNVVIPKGQLETTLEGLTISTVCVCEMIESHTIPVHAADRG